MKATKANKFGTELQQEQPQFYENLMKQLEGGESQVLQAAVGHADTLAQQAAANIGRWMTVLSTVDIPTNSLLEYPRLGADNVLPQMQQT